MTPGATLPSPPRPLNLPWSCGTIGVLAPPWGRPNSSAYYSVMHVSPSVMTLPNLSVFPLFGTRYLVAGESRF